MFKLFRRTNKTTKSTQYYDNNPVETDYCHVSTTNYSTEINTKIYRLIELIGSAIEEWTLEFHMENLPKRVVLEQVLDVMRIIEMKINSKL